MIEKLKSNAVTIIFGFILTGLLSWGVSYLKTISENTNEVPKIKEQNNELRTELKELRKEFEAFQKDEWGRYVELNTTVFGNNYKLRKELGK
jgi:predicted RNase H-like nuclease (RuvC/YqgF family)